MAPNLIGSAFIAVRPETTGFGGEVESKLKGIFSGASGVLAGTTVAAIGVGAALLDIGTKFQSSYNAIARGTGATGDQLNKLKGDFKNVLAGTAGSFEQVQAAIIGVSRATGLTGPPLDLMAKQFVTLGRITKTDVAANIAATEPLFAKFNIQAKDQGAALDVLFKASQFSGLSVAELADKMKTGGTVLKDFGYTFSQSAALIAEFTKAGVNSDQAISALKKGFASFAKAGEDPQKAMNALVASIKKAPSEAAATGLALKAFGAKAGPELVAAIRSGRLNVDELTRSIASGKDGIMATANATPTLAGAFAKLKNQVLVALEPIATKLLGLTTIVVGKIIPVFRSMIGLIAPVFEKLGSLWDAFMGGFENPRAQNSVKGFVGTLISFGQEAKKIFDAIRLGWDLFMGGFQNPDAQNAVSGFAGTMIKFGQIVRPIFEWVKANIQPILIGLGIAFVALTAPILLVVGGLTYLYLRFQVVRDVVAGVVDFFTNVALPAIIGWVTFIANALKPLVDAFVSRWGEIKQIVTTAFQFIVGWISFEVAAIQEIWSVFGATIIRVAMAVWDQIRLVVTTAINIVADIVKFVLDLLTGHWSKAWNDLLDILRNVMNVVIGTLNNALSIIGNVLASLGGIVLRELGKLPGQIGAILVGIDKWLFNAGVNLIEGLINGIISMIGRLGNVVGGAVHSALSHIPGASLLHDAGIPGFALGGTVPGPIGRPQLAIVHGGEEVLTPEQQRQRASGSFTTAGASPSVSIVQNILTQHGQSNTEIGQIAAAKIAWDAKPLGTGGR